MTSGRENHGSEVPDQRKAEHDIWLAMQAAFKKYRNASAALEFVISQLRGAVPSSEGSLRLEAATSEQRVAFENYIEARVQFVECRCDANCVRTRGLADPNTVGGSSAASEENSAGASWSEIKIPRLALPAVVTALLLCTAALSLDRAVRERRDVRDANTARDAIRLTLNQTRDDVQALARKLDAVNATQALVIRDPASSPVAPGPPRRASGTQMVERKRIEKVRRRRTQPPTAPLHKRSNVASTNEKLIHHVQNLGGSRYWEFTLPISTRYEDVGPLRVSLRSVDLTHKYFDLCVVADNFKLKHINLHEPVSITLNKPLRRMELVATRLDKNHVQGYLSELPYRKSELTASHVPPRPSGGS